MGNKQGRAGWGVLTGANDKRMPIRESIQEDDK